MARFVPQSLPLFSRVRLQLRSGDVCEGILEEVEGGNLIVTGEDGPDLIEAREVEAAVVLTPPPSAPPPPPPQSTPPPASGQPSTGKSPDVGARTKSRSGSASAGVSAEPNPVVEEVHRTGRELRDVLRNAPPPAYVFAGFDAVLDVSPTPKSLAAEWNALHDKLSHALRVHETAPRFGRIQSLVGRLEALRRAIPGSLLVRQTLAACYRWLEDKDRSLAEHERLALENSRAGMEDFRRWAATAHDTGCMEAERRALAELLRRTPISTAPDLFHRLLRLCIEEKRFEALLDISAHRLVPMPAEDWRRLLQSVVVITAQHGDEGRAFRSWSRFAEGHPAPQLVEELLGWLLEHFPPPPAQVRSKESAAQATQPAASPPRIPRLGTIQRFKKTFGFLRDDEGKEYFFHHSEVRDTELHKHLESGTGSATARVCFFSAHGEDGQCQAVHITLYRSPEQILALAGQCARIGEFADAARWLEKYLVRFPDSPELRQRMDLWKCWGTRGDYPKGDSPLAQGRRAMVLENNPRKALGLFREALRHFDQREQAAVELAGLCTQNKWIGEAIRELTQAARRGARCKVYEQLLADLYARIGNAAKSLEYIEGLLEARPDAAQRESLLLQAAERQLELRRPEEALQRVEDTAKETAQTARALKIKVSACLMLGHTAQAMQTLQDIPGETPDERIAVLKQFLDVHELLHENAALRRELDGMQQAHKMAGTAAHAPEDQLPAKRQVIVIGDSNIAKNILVAIAKSFGMTTRQIDFHLDYQRIKQAGIEKYRYNDRIAGILVGPCPHKAADVFDCSSLLEQLKEDGFPPFEEIRTERGDLKITRTSYRQALLRLLRRVGPRLGINPSMLK